MSISMSEEEKIEKAVAALNKAKQYLRETSWREAHRLGICIVLVYTSHAWEGIEDVLARIEDKIRTDVCESGGSCFLYPLNGEGYTRRLVYLNDLIRNIKDYA
jgi:hypothetical protein